MMHRHEKVEGPPSLVQTSGQRDGGRVEQGYQVERCFGERGCPNQAVYHGDLLQRLAEVFERSDLRGFLKENVKGPLKSHHVFRVSVSDCPNACSRPQIADVGLIGALRPKIGEGLCTQCGACVEICREQAITLEPGRGVPTLDPRKCLSCGQCIRVCPPAALAEDAVGYRILIGGKLGRHPQLGRELSRIFPLAEAVQVVQDCLRHYLAHSRNGERLGEVLRHSPVHVSERPQGTCAIHSP